MVHCNCHFYGIYRGIVTAVADPEGLMRIKAVVPQVLGESPTGWMWPCVDVGATTVPALNAPVWVMFEAGDPNYPVWLGTWKVV